jgi:hypothetical protein
VVRAREREALSGAGQRLGLRLVQERAEDAADPAGHWGSAAGRRGVSGPDPAEVGEKLGKFRARYGARDVAAYFPKQDAALEVPLALRLGPQYVGASYCRSEFVGAGYLWSEFVGAGYVGSEFVGPGYFGSEFVGPGYFGSE